MKGKIASKKAECHKLFSVAQEQDGVVFQELTFRNVFVFSYVYVCIICGSVYMSQKPRAVGSPRDYRLELEVVMSHPI